MTASQFAPSAGWPRRPQAGASGRALALLGALAVALGAAFVLAPGGLAASAPGGGYAGQPALIRALHTAFTGYWSSGDRAYPPDLERLVDYWTRYHVAKAVIAALLLTVLVILGRRLWAALLGAARLTPGRGAALTSSLALVAVLAVGSVTLVMANIQGAVAPFASLISMLPSGPHDEQLIHTLGQVKQGLAAYPGSGGRTAPAPALEAMISGFVLYHVAVVALAAVVAVTLAVMSAVSWKRRARTRSSERRTRHALAIAAVSSALLALVMIVIAAANLGNAMNPAPALLALFNSGAAGL